MQPSASYNCHSRRYKASENSSHERVPRHKPVHIRTPVGNHMNVHVKFCKSVNPLVANLIQTSTESIHPSIFSAQAANLPIPHNPLPLDAPSNLIFTPRKIASSHFSRLVRVVCASVCKVAYPYSSICPHGTWTMWMRMQACGKCCYHP